MEYEVYLNDEDNVFHQLRGHYLRLNRDMHFDFDTFKKPEKEKKVVDTPDKKNIQVSILEARIQKMQYMKMRRKGVALDEENVQKDLQSINSQGYYSLDHLWEKLKENDDINGDEEKQMKYWRQLTYEEKQEKLILYCDKFKELMEMEVWKEMKESLMENLKEGLITSNNVVWHKGTQKIMEISGFVINPTGFYWN